MDKNSCWLMDCLPHHVTNNDSYLLDQYHKILAGCIIQGEGPSSELSLNGQKFLQADRLSASSCDE